MFKFTFAIIMLIIPVVTSVKLGLVYDILIIILYPPLFEYQIWKAFFNIGLHNSNVELTWCQWSPKQAEEVAELTPKIEKIFAEYIVQYDGRGVHHMGSTAIKGMPGSGALDICIVTKGLLPNVDDQLIKKVEKETGF